MKKQVYEEKKVYTLQEWLKEAKELFGTDIKVWKFKCTACGHVQSIEEFQLRTELSDERIRSVLGFSCIGRFLKDQEPKKGKNNDFPIRMEGGGCNWTYGGLFGDFGKGVIISYENGKVHRNFPFAKKDHDLRSIDNGEEV